MSRFRVVVTLAVIGLLWRPSANAGQQTLRYEPAVVTLSGSVRLEKHFGPPGFGRTPALDRAEQIPILLLDGPVTVQAAPAAPGQPALVDGDTYSGVTRLQLVFEKPGAKTAGLDGERVTVTGQLFEKVSGENFTDVLLTVQNLSLGASQAR